MRKRLIKYASIPHLMADLHRIERTDRYVLELLMFGFAHASRYVLLRSRPDLSRLDDEQYMKDAGERPSKYGRILAFDADLFLDPVDASLWIELG